MGACIKEGNVLSMSAITTTIVDERRQIEMAADEYEGVELHDEPVLPLSVVPEHFTLPCDNDTFDSTSVLLNERLTSSRSTSSMSSNAEDEDVDEVMAPDLPTRDQSMELAEEESGTIERHFSSVSLGDSELSVAAVAGVAMDDKPPVAINDVSRAIMSNRYARAVPSAQESQSFTAASTSTCLLSKGFTLPGSPLTVLIDTPVCCTSASCQQQNKWKDERIHELQRALDLMVDAMVIQQRDMAAQRAFLARQSEQLTKLSVTLHQEKLVLQIEKERMQKVMRAAACSPSGRPPTPSGSSSRSSTPRGSNKPKTSMKAVFSTITGSSSARTDSGRRCTVSSIDEHAAAAFVLPLAAEYPSAVFSARSASTSQLATELVVSSRDAVCTSSFSDARTSNADSSASTIAAEFERSVSLSALEVRTTQPSPPWPLSSTGGKAQMMSDVSLQDSPVRFGRRSATNCVTSKGRSKDTASLSSSAAAAAEIPTAIHTGESNKKPSLGDRFRSLRWKA